MADRHVRRSGNDYAQQLVSLLPRGPAWSRDPGSTLMRAVIGLAQYWGFVDSRAADLLETESDPRTTWELLPDWERAWGLPDPCVAEPVSPDDRRSALVANMTMLGGQSRAFFYGIADQLGYHITITEYSPYICGISRAGDTRGLDPDHQPNAYRWHLGPGEMRYAWSIHVDALRLTYFRTGQSMCGVDRLLRIGIATDLECIFRRWKPAHTDIIFDYSPFVALDYTELFNTQYLALGVP
jgi:uncharacterized protein YmfQ (DUF2313 family)